MKFSRKIVRACRHLIDEDKFRATMTSGATVTEVYKVEARELNNTSTTTLAALLERLNKGSAFGVISIVWGKYILQELPSETNIYFIIYESEG